MALTHVNKKKNKNSNWMKPFQTHLALEPLQKILFRSPEWRKKSSEQSVWTEVKNPADVTSTLF